MFKNDFSDFIAMQLKKGQYYFTCSMKSMVQYENAELLDAIEDDNRAFLDPMLFAYLNSGDDAITLEQVLWGYTSPDKRPSYIEVISNSAGIIFLPNIGYAQTDKRNQRLILSTDKMNAYHLYSGTQKAPFTLMNNKLITGTDIEIQQFSHQSFETYFRDPGNNIITVDLKGGYRKYINMLNTSAAILSTYYPTFYEYFTAATKWILPFASPDANSFAALSMHGVAFLNVHTYDDEVGCIEDILHQCGHIIFTAITHNPAEYFQVHPDTPLKNIGMKETEHRSVYVALHGVFTEALMIEIFDICLENSVFSGRQEHELKGRLVYILIRFLLDMEALNRDDIFTDKAQHIYNELKDIMIEAYLKYKSLIPLYNITNQPYNFNYDKFLSANPI